MLIGSLGQVLQVLSFSGFKDPYQMKSGSGESYIRTLKSMPGMNRHGFIENNSLKKYL